LSRLDCTGVILAGGMNSRLPGKKKMFRKVGDTTMLEAIHTLFDRVFKEVILVVNDPKAFAMTDALIVTDIDPSRCALAGLHTGLYYASHPWIYATACDVPFASEAVIRHLWASRRKGKEIIIPRTREGLEPLSALYNKTCLQRMEKSLSEKRFMIKKAFNFRRVMEIAPETLERLDPDMRFKFNVNTPEDLVTARTMAGKKS